MKPTAYQQPAPLADPPHICRVVIEWDARDGAPDIGLFNELYRAVSNTQANQTRILYAEANAPAWPLHARNGGEQ